MDNNELLAQIAALIEQSEERTSQRFTRLEIKIENEVTKRIDSLVDGYKLTHEKQWELEQQTLKLQKQIEDMQARLTALENRIA